MPNPFRFFKCNIINGCRLSDIERFVTRDEVFYLNAHIACTSRSVNAAINANWIIEISEKEASKSINIPTFAEPVVKKIEIEEKTIHSSDMKINQAAFERHQARLKKLEKTKDENNEKIENEIQIEPGKNVNANLGALQRIQNRNKKVKNAKQQEKDFVDDVVDTNQEGVKTSIAISKQMNENKTTPKTEQVVKKTKTDLKQELETKLQEKILEKKTIKINKEPIVDEVLGKVSLNTPEVKRRGRPLKNDVSVIEEQVEKQIVKKGRPKKDAVVSEKPVKTKGRPKKQAFVEMAHTARINADNSTQTEKKKGRPKGSKTHNLYRLT